MKLIVSLLLFVSVMVGQPSRNRDLGSSNVRQGATLPSTCQASPNADVFYKSGTAAGMYVCSATNTWTISVPGATLDAVTGASVLTSAGAIPKVGAVAGTLAQSALTDDGTKIGTTLPISLGTKYLSTTKTAGTTGVTQNLLVKLDASGNVVTAATSDVGILGIAMSTKTFGQSVEVATRGIVSCVADNTTIVGNLLIAGTSTAGRCRDSGQTASTSLDLTTQVLGRALTAVAAGFQVSVQFYGPGHYGAAQTALTEQNTVPIINSSLGLGLSKLKCPLGICTLYDDTAVTGVTTLKIQAGAGQASSNLQEWKNAAGSILSKVDQYGDIQSTFTDRSSAVRLNDYALLLGSVSKLTFGNTTNYGSTADLGIGRLSAGNLEVTSGTTGKPAGLTVGSLTTIALATPSAPTVTPTCPDGACGSTWTYACVDLAGDGTTTLQGATLSTSANNDTLDATHYNTITCPVQAAATKRTFRRTASGGTPATTGALATCTAVTATSCVDNGLVGDGSAAPGANTTGQGLFAGNVSIGTTGPGASLQVNGTGIKIVQTSGVALDLSGTTNTYFSSAANNSFMQWADAGGTQRIIFGVSTDNNTYLLSAPGKDIVLKPENVSGLGITIKATNGYLGLSTTSPDRLLHAELSDSTTNAVGYVQRLSHISSGTVAAGFGAGLEFELETATDATNKVAATIEAAWTTATAGAEDSYLTFSTVKAGTLGERVRITNNGVEFVTSNALVADIVTIRGGGVSGNYGFLIEAAGGDDIFRTDNFTYNITMASRGGLVGIGTTDLDGTPAAGQLTIKGTTNNGTTNILVGRDSDEANVLTIDTDGVITPGGYKAADGTVGVTVTTCTGFKNGLCISGT